MENRLETLIRRLIHALERANIEEYMRYSASWRRQLLVNFMGGLARGFGMAVGFTILGALMVMLLSRLDNLGKGASGAAVQNMNLLMGCPEETGLQL